MDLTALLKTFDLEPFDVPMIALGAVMVFVFLRLLKSVLFDPYRELFEAREAATAGTEGRARELLDRAAQLRTEIDTKLTEARVEIIRRRSQILDAARSEASAIVEKAEAEAAEKTRGVRWEINSKIDSLRGAVSSDLDSMVHSVTERVLR